jgi:excisionase family DNA binding protein
LNDVVAVLAPILPLSPAARVRTVLLMASRSAEFRRRYLSSFEVAPKLRVNPETVRKWIQQGELSGLRVRQGRLFVDRRELAAFVKQLPKRARRRGRRSLSTDG